jgi:sterol desaturase/sphingolipid hydroxylase (fatty acid hydroxylase superfamily)
VSPRGDRHRQPAGTEPVTARSPLRLRAILSGVALAAAAVAGTVFLLYGLAGSGPGAAPWVVAAICGAVVMIATVDLWVIWRRSRI